MSSYAVLRTPIGAIGETNTSPSRFPEHTWWMKTTDQGRKSDSRPRSMLGVAAFAVAFSEVKLCDELHEPLTVGLAASKAQLAVVLFSGKSFQYFRPCQRGPAATQLDQSRQQTARESFHVSQLWFLPPPDATNQHTSSCCALRAHSRRGQGKTVLERLHLRAPFGRVAW